MNVICAAVTDLKIEYSKVQCVLHEIQRLTFKYSVLSPHFLYVTA